MEDSSSDADRLLASQKFPPFGGKPEVNYGAHMNPYSHRKASASRQRP
jgi:hypothetical protein